MSLTQSTLQRVETLKKKYAAIGQSLDGYLDGLIFSNPLKYWDYIEVDALLSLQKPRTDFPDEKIFIVYHQITELYFELILHELDQICHNGKIISDVGRELGWNSQLSPSFFTERLQRINRYFDIIIRSFDVMQWGMENDQFTKFRMALLSASGFQTVAYRKIEIMCTDYGHLVDKTQREALSNADFHTQLDHAYWRKGAIVAETQEKTFTLRDFEEKYMATLHQFASAYQPINLWKKYRSLSEADQKQPQLIQSLRQLDVHMNVNWPLVHYRAAAHYMGDRKGGGTGTGGTNWKSYLPPHFQQLIFYPELWSEKEREEWGKEWVAALPIEQA